MNKSEGGPGLGRFILGGGGFRGAGKSGDKQTIEGRNREIQVKGGDWRLEGSEQ